MSEMRSDSSEHSLHRNELGSRHNVVFVVIKQVPPTFNLTHWAVLLNDLFSCIRDPFPLSTLSITLIFQKEKIKLLQWKITKQEFKLKLALTVINKIINNFNYLVFNHFIKTKMNIDKWSLITTNNKSSRTRICWVTIVIDVDIKLLNFLNFCDLSLGR